jgi:predicted MFS family arabinose efflux permease
MPTPASPTGSEPAGGALARWVGDPDRFAREHWARAPLHRPAADAAGFGDLLRSRAFWALALPFFVCGITTTGLVDTHLIPLAQDRGISVATTGLAVALLAAANVTGILASGPLADRVDNRVLLFALYATRGASLVALLLFAGPQALIAFALLFGLVDFSTVAPTQWLAARYVQPQAVGLAFGCLNAIHQLGSALGAWLPGVAYDASGSYDGVLVISASVLAVAALTCLTLPRPRPLAPQPA